MGVAGHHVPVWYDESSGPASGQVMSWNAVTGRWEATDIDTAAIDTAGLATDAELAAGLATKEDSIPPGTYVPYVTGLDPTGVAPQSTIINAKLAAAADGDTLVFREGDYLIDAPLDWSGKRLHLRTEGVVRFVEASVFTLPILTGTNASGSTVDGFHVVGAETLASFGTPVAISNRIAVKMVTSTGVTVSNITVTGKSLGVMLDTCDYSKVLGLDVVGLATSGQTVGINYNTAVFVRGGAYNDVAHVSARTIGSAVLAGNSTVALDVNAVVGMNTFDNGIYISSGNYCTVRGCRIVMTSPGTGGTAIKCRGTANSIIGNVADGTTLGFTLTGLDSVTDAFGDAGHGSRVIGNYGANLLYDGIRLEADVSRFLRNCVISGNVLENVGTTGSSTVAGIQIAGGNGHVITGNNIRGVVSTLGGIFVAGVTGTHATGHIITNNIISGCAGDGIRTNYVDKSTISNNRIAICGLNGIRHFDGSNCEIRHNTATDSITSIGLRVETGTGNVVVGNRTSSLSITAGNTASENGTNANGARLAEAGSAAAPSFSFEGDPNTGIYSVAADDIGIAAGGAVRVRVQTTQLILTDGMNVSIGTTTGTKLGVGITSKLGFWGATPIAQPARAGQLTDNSGGTSGGATIAVVTDNASAANAIATLAAKVNALEAKLSAAAGGVGLTA